ncbi:MAG: LysR family transcriptional regulator [Halioglobus sp.]
MDIKELGRLDLNLLVALEALLEERNVSRAAQRLFISQSAMSKTLGRLRELFDDPLFIRKTSGMVPTPRAEQLAAQLVPVLKLVQDMVQPVDFDPLTYTGKFRFLVEGHMGVWIMPMLLQRLQETAPGIYLRTVSSADAPLDMLATGELDFVLQGERQSYPADYCLTTLGYAPPRLLARKGHPLEGTELTWDTLLQYPQVQLLIPELLEIQFHAPENSTFVRREAEVSPRLRTDHLHTAIRVVLSSDYVFPAPPLFMAEDDLARGLIALPLPGGEELSITYVMVRHERVGHSPAHEFMRREILAVIDQFRHDAGLPSLAELRVQRKLAY